MLADPPAAAPKPDAPAATADLFAVDKQMIAEAKKGSEIIANLTYLSDIIGPRLTGSATLKRPTNGRRRRWSYGLTNVHLEPGTFPSAGTRQGDHAHHRAGQWPYPHSGRDGLVAQHEGQNRGEVVILKAKNAAELDPYKGKLKNAVILQQRAGQSGPGPSTSSQQQRPRQERKATSKAAMAGQAERRAPPPPACDRSLYGVPPRASEFLRTEGVAACSWTPASRTVC